jgi:hypothetical protein
VTTSLRIVGDPIAQIAADLRHLDPRVRVEVVEPWTPSGCQLCGLLECDDTAVVMWVAGTALREVRVAVEHVVGWVSGFVLSDQAPDCSEDYEVVVELARVA